MTILEQGDILRYVRKRRLGSLLMKKGLLKSSEEGSEVTFKKWVGESGIVQNSRQRWHRGLDLLRSSPTISKFLLELHYKISYHLVPFLGVILSIRG